MSSLTYQIPVEPTEEEPHSHPRFVETRTFVSNAAPRVGDRIEYEDIEYEVKAVMWKDLEMDRALVILK